MSNTPDERAKCAAIEYLSHRGENPYRILRGGSALWETHLPAMQAALQSAADTPAPKVEPVAWATIPKVSGGLRWTTDIKAQAERWEADGHALAPLYEHPPQPKAALQRALDFMEWLSVEPVLDINDQELTLSDVSRYAAIELDSIRKSLPPSKVREE